MYDATCKRFAPNELNARRLGHITLFLKDLNGGGVQRVSRNLANTLAERGHQVELVLCSLEGPLRNQVSDRVKVIGLKAASNWLARAFALVADPRGFKKLLRPVLLPLKPSKTLSYLPSLTHYLRRNSPSALFAATPHLNVEAVLARCLADVPTRLVLSEHTNLSHSKPLSKKWRRRYLPPLLHRTYMVADAIVAVSNGVADDLASYIDIPSERITTIYNPVVLPEMLDKALELLEHPWFVPSAPPVVLGVGRLGPQKDFPTLLRAFARVRAKRPARLMILGEVSDASKQAKRRAEVTSLAAKLGIRGDIALPGFVHNPFAYMAHAAVFVLSSCYEGLPNVLIEALACGCPVVSTDCPSGPAEILEKGKFGPLVPVGDDAAMAEAIFSILDAPPNPAKLRARGAEFSANRAVKRYEEVLLGPMYMDSAASQCN